jgi:hypothetical protein
MGSSFLSSAAYFIETIIRFIASSVSYVYGAIIAAVLILLLARYLIDVLQISPFGRAIYYLRRPGNELLHNMRSSRFYVPLKRALGFDPAVLMVLVATAIVCYVVSEIIGYLITLMGGLAGVLKTFDIGRALTAGRYLIGVLLLGIVFYLLTLMLIVFVNWLFGLLRGIANRAMYRIEPLLRIFEFGGVFAGWSFLILYIALTFAARAITVIFFS